MIKKLKTKLKSRRAMTLTELLVALVIVALLTTAVVTGVGSAMQSYEKITTSSEAAILCGTLVTEISDELRFAESIAKDADGNITYYSTSHGNNVSLASSDGRITVAGKQLLSEKAYTGLDADLELDYLDGVFSVTISISKGDKSVSSSSFNISPIND